MHIFLENCKQTTSWREEEEENLPVTAVGKAAEFSLQHESPAQPGPVFEATQVTWCCLSMHHTKLLKVL